MRTARTWVGLSVVSMFLTMFLSMPGCGSGAATDTGPTMKDAPPAQAGQMSSEDFNKNRKKK